MSAPLVVNTTDGTVWTRRTVTRGGLALYAPEGVCSCPEFVMATLPELAEHGIAGSADVLPVPAGPEPQSDTLAAWLHWRFGPHSQSWNALSDDDQTYWQHQARAVRRAVERGGFKPGGRESTLALRTDERLAGEAPIAYELTDKAATVEDVTPQVRKLRALLAGQRAAVEDPYGLHHSYLLGRELPETGGAR